MKFKQVVILAGILLLFACNNEDSVESINFEDSAYGVVGRWYTESNVDDPLFNMFGEYVFTGYGAIYGDEYRKINGYRRAELQGIYIISNNSITTEYGINEGGRSTMPFAMENGLSFSASFHRFSEDYTLTFNRIVGEIILSVDSTLNVETDVKQNVAAYTAQQIDINGYNMLDEAIASVDANGFITTKLAGVTFLKVKTTVGTAVLKISVSDTKNMWNDFSLVLGKNFNEVEHLMGKHYAFKNDSVIRYFYDNAYIDSVDIYRHGAIADSIIVALRDTVTEETVNNYLSRTLYLVKDTTSYCSYVDNENFLLTSYSAICDKKLKKLSYTYFDPDWNDRLCDYRLTYEELRKKYGVADDKKETYAFYKGKYDFVTEIIYHFNNDGEVDQYSFYVNPDIKTSMIMNYLNSKFIYKDSNAPYVRNFQYNGKEMINSVTISENNHRLNYFFIENK